MEIIAEVIEPMGRKIYLSDRESLSLSDKPISRQLVIIESFGVGDYI